VPVAPRPGAGLKIWSEQIPQRENPYPAVRWGYKNPQPDWQTILRITGGFFSVRIEGPKATARHHDVDGKVVNEVTVPR
jgi:hypothetical protein